MVQSVLLGGPAADCHVRNGVPINLPGHYVRNAKKLLSARSVRCSFRQPVVDCAASLCHSATEPIRSRFWRSPAPSVRRSPHHHPMPPNNPPKPLINPRPLHDIHLERQIRLTQCLVQGRDLTQRKRLVPHDGKIEIRILLRSPGRARSEHEHLAIRHVPSESVTDDSPMIRPKVHPRGRRTHANRSRNRSRRWVTSSRNSGMWVTTSTAMASLYVWLVMPRNLR